MKRNLCHSDIRDIQADALIYSTNVQLMLSGGVGACLLDRFGRPFQADLFAELDKTGRKLARVGDIFQTYPANTPWKTVCHTVATDPFYHTDPSIVRGILERCFARCSGNEEIQSIVTSPLGAGYGDLRFPLFLDIVSDLTQHDCRFSEITICCDDSDFFAELLRHSKTLSTEWTA